MNKSKKRRGKFIVFEGIDGAGVETQGKLLTRYFKKQKEKVQMLDYPDYKHAIGKLIHQYLYKKYNFSADIQFLLHLADFLKDKENIVHYLRKGENIISLRYFTSTLAYQGLKGFPIKKGLEIAKLVSLPKPDLVIYLDISPETSMRRKRKEKRKLDRNESNKILLSKVRRFYKKLVKGQVFAKWVSIDGEESVKDVFQKVLRLSGLK